MARSVRTAGLVLVRQRPGSAKNVTFITIEDDTGVANLVVWPDLFEKQRRIVLNSTLLGIQGIVQREGDVIHFICARLFDLTQLLSGLGDRGREGSHRMRAQCLEISKRFGKDRGTSTNCSGKMNAKAAASMRL